MLSTGDRLGPYQILAPLGAGGMGEVWKAWDTRLDRTVAIKTVNGPFSERFEREAKAISSLNHPHICTLHDVGDHEGTGYLVMELVEGTPLAGPLPLATALKYAREICEALEAAHKKGIVHRDLKPANILVTKAGVKLLDFGLAKQRAGRAEAGQAGRADTNDKLTQVLTGAHTILGTPQYMAPEQIEGKDADARTDIFALGCVLYQLLTGQKAFEGKSPSSVMAAILATEPRPLKELQPLTPPALERAIKRCLAKDPDDRWQSARDLRAELEWIGSTISGPSTVTTEASPRASSRLPWALAAFLAVTTAGALVLWRSSDSPAPERRSVALEIYPPAGYVFDSQPMLSPDGRQVAFLARDRSGKPSAFVRRLDSTTAERLPIELTSLSGWSGDSRFLAFRTGTLLRKVEVSSGTVQTLCDCGGRGSPLITWNQDGVIILSLQTNQTGPLMRVSASGGTPTPITTLNTDRQEYVHQNANFLPDGRHFLYFARSRQPQSDAVLLGSLDLAAGEQPRAPLFVSASTALYAGGSEAAGRLLFARNGALMAQPFDLRSLQLTGDPTQVTPNVGFTGATTINASGSLEGSVIAYSKEFLGGPAALKQFAWFDRSGQLLQEVGRSAAYREFSLSPDGKRVAAARIDSPNTDIWIVDLARDGVATRFTTDPAQDAQPIWSHDGAELVFSRGRVDGSAIVKRSFSGQRVESVVTEIGGLVLDWSSDSRTVLFSAKDDLWALTDGKTSPVVETPFVEREGRFSPEGRWVAFVSDESKQNEVYVQGFPSGPRHQVSTAGGTQPRWRRDGRELYYVGLDGKLMVVPIKAGGGFDYDVAKPLFDTLLLGQNVPGDYAVSDNGERFLLEIPDRTAGSAPFTVVTNWSSLEKK